MDDYHAVHGHDISSFDIPSIHRLPTIAASQVLHQLQDKSAFALPTGLEILDRTLAGAEAGDSDPRGGFKRGHVTEIWGPPGTGKTALALAPSFSCSSSPSVYALVASQSTRLTWDCRIQTAAHAICAGHDVVWVDCFQRVHSDRLRRAIESVQAGKNGGDSAIDWTKFAHLSCLTLPHLMVLVSRPTPRLIGTGVSLIVLSSATALLNSALPKPREGPGKTGPTAGGTDLVAATKRKQGLHFVMHALQKLAATRNCAVVILSQCATRMQSEQGATLVSAVNASVWEQAISTRLVLFRDWVWRGGKLDSVSVAGVQKIDGQATKELVGERAPAFKVEPSGAVGIDVTAVCSAPASPVDSAWRKRKLEQTELEIPDSEADDDDDYGWADDEAALPAPPPQWQGSEDTLLGLEMGRAGAGTDEATDDDA